MYRLLSALPASQRPPTSELLGVDPARGVLAFAALEGVATLVHGLFDWDASPETYAAVGREIAQLHELPVEQARLAELREEPFGEPNRIFPVAIPLEAYGLLSSGMLDFYRLVQRDIALHRPIALIHEGTEDRAVIHGDLRGDQVVLPPEAPQAPLLIDFEEARIADPARDVGALVGEVLRLVVMTASTSDDDVPASPSGSDDRAPAPTSTSGDRVPRAQEASTDRVVAAAMERMADAAPLLSALREGYGDTAQRWSADFPERVLRVAGWHLFDRALAVAQHGVALSVRDKAGAGIGRRLLCDPARYRAALGWA